jgi:hypothetical protein
MVAKVERRSLIKNLFGIQTQTPIIALAFDDFGVVRLASSEARDKLQVAGMRGKSWMDQRDCLESREDIAELMEVLTSVKDTYGRSARLTAYSVVAAPKFEEVLVTQRYSYQKIPDYMNSLVTDGDERYSGAWAVWEEGIRCGIIRPQFHGREHFDVAGFEENLKRRDRLTLLNMRLRSVAGIDQAASRKEIGFTHAFGWQDGLELFEKIYGFKSLSFVPPGLEINSALYPVLQNAGVKLIDKEPLKVRPRDRRWALAEFNWTGRLKYRNIYSFIRNVMFEPTKYPNFDSIDHALRQISVAFRLNRPAIISSHRVNYVGGIDSDAASNGRVALRDLLLQIIRHWPTAKFVFVDELLECNSVRSRGNTKN